MSIKYQYTIFIVVLHTVIACLIYYILRENKWYFILSELGMIASFFLSYKIYANFIKPVELMQTGVDAIKDEDFNVKFLKTGSGDINDLIGVFNAMLDRLKEERVRTQEQAYVLESVIAASPIGMIMLDYDDNIAEMNPSAKNILGIGKNLNGQKLKSIPHLLIADLLKLPIGAKKIISTEGINKYRCQTNTIIHRGFKRKFLMVEELSKEILENEKAAYGKVIRMMAHEVNNSMGAVNSILQTVIDFGFQDNDEDLEFVESLEIARDRNKDLALFMKNFADIIRVPEPFKQSTSLNQIINHCTSIMLPQLEDRKIQLEVNSTPETHVWVDGILLEQVIVNILKNAMESIQEEGIIRITISKEAPQLILSDNGRGIKAEDRPKLFTPFFSTKPTGQGIGLMLIREILMRHQAQFRLYTNAKGGWTHFEIAFQ